MDPTNERIAEMLGAQTKPANSRYDLAVIGGGPAGLTAAMYGRPKASARYCSSGKLSADRREPRP